MSWYVCWSAIVSPIPMLWPSTRSQLLTTVWMLPYSSPAISCPISMKTMCSKEPEEAPSVFLHKIPLMSCPSSIRTCWFAWHEWRWVDVLIKHLNGYLMVNFLQLFFKVPLTEMLHSQDANVTEFQSKPGSFRFKKYLIDSLRCLLVSIIPRNWIC